MNYRLLARVVGTRRPVETLRRVFPTALALAVVVSVVGWAFCQEQKATAPKSEPAAEPAKAAAEEMTPEMKALMEQMEAEQRALEKAMREDPAWQPSHKTVAVIEVGKDLEQDGVHNFCLGRDGNLLVCCGGKREVYIGVSEAGEMKTKTVDEPAEIRVVSPEGRLLRKIPMPFTPEAVCVLGDGTIFVGGDGKVARLDAEGKVSATADSPALAKPESEADDAKDQKSDSNDVKEEKKTKGKREGDKDNKEKKEKLPFQALIEVFSGVRAETESALEKAQADAFARRAREVTGIAATDRDLFLACPDSKGFGYAVYRMSHDLGDVKKIVEGLRGCCGQMDVQAHDGELWIPENARHRVSRYDRDGKRLKSFGKRDRRAADGFGGCCEPKNLRFGPDGMIYAAASGEPVAIKKFSPDGEFLGVVGLPKFKTGCVRVTVEVSRDAEKVFILSPEDNAIHVLQDRRNLPTHAQARIIKMPETDKPAEINTFCVAKDGNLLVARGGRRVSYNRTAAGFEMKVVEEPAQVSVVSPEGKLLASWPMGFGPQAVNVAEDGAVFVAGEGRIARLAPDGKIHAESDIPSAVDLPPVPSPPADAKEDEEAKKARQQKLADLTRQRDEVMQELTELQKKVFAPGADADSKTAARDKQKELMPKYEKLLQDLRQAGTTPEMVAIQEWAGAMRRRAVSGVAASGDDVFICCSAVQGYGFDVWRTDRDFNNPKKIVQGLRGCCGQMDIQARGGELYAAENTQFQVARFDRDGKELGRFGRRDRSGFDGFGSCCNPMNIRLDKDGQVITSESNLGRIKRFSPDGRFLGLVGTVEIVPGCKHVAVAASDDGRRMYLLDITRSHVVVLDAKEEAPPH